MPESPRTQSTQGEREREPCAHDSIRRDGCLDDHCLRCGADGYWRDGVRYDERHPSGKLLFRVEWPDVDPSTDAVSTKLIGHMAQCAVVVNESCDCGGVWR